MHRGYVKVWRKIKDSGLLQLPKTLALFMHVLLNATHKDIKVGTQIGVIKLKRGQYISGIYKLASELAQTPQEIRTSIKRLKELQILTSTATSRFSVYTIVKYNNYQDVEIDLTSTATNEQQAGNKLATTKQEHKNIRTETTPQFVPDKNIATKHGLMAAALIKLGVRVASHNPTLQCWVADGISVERAIEAVSIARQSKPAPQPIACNYLDAILRTPPAPKHVHKPQWWLTEQATLDKAAELGIKTRGGEGWPELRERIRTRIEDLKHNGAG